jgi:hypothetical protein
MRREMRWVHTLFALLLLSAVSTVSFGLFEEVCTFGKTSSGFANGCLDCMAWLFVMTGNPDRVVFIIILLKKSSFF